MIENNRLFPVGRSNLAVKLCLTCVTLVFPEGFGRRVRIALKLLCVQVCNRMVINRAQIAIPDYYQGVHYRKKAQYLARHELCVYKI